MLDQLHIGHQGVNAMKANAKRGFFCPRMSAQIQNRRDQCKRCNEIAPSNRNDINFPVYPFQHTVADLFHMVGRMYIVYADRFFRWTEVAATKPDASASTIITILRQYFTSFGVPEEISTDGGPPFNSHDVNTFLQSWNVSHRTSSVGYPQSNGRAEAAVKITKRIFTTNVSPSGSLDTDEVSKFLLLYQNTHAPDMGVSPAEHLFGRYTQFIENKQTSPLWELHVGDPVSLQNQTGNQSLRWQKTGIVAEALPHQQYRVVVDGSRRTTLRNLPECRQTDIVEPSPPLTDTPNETVNVNPSATNPVPDSADIQHNDTEQHGAPPTNCWWNSSS